MGERAFSTHLAIEGLKLKVSLGCNEEEKKRLQEVEIDLWIFFPTPPAGCISDRIEEVICYDSCVKKLREIGRQKHFCLIEHLAFACHKSLKETLPKELKIGIRVSKLEHPLADVKTVRFSYFGESCLG